jgi:hypothetical protein
MQRREFLKTAALAAAVPAEAKPKVDSETLVATLYKSLTPDQKSKVCMPFDHALRSKVDANWFITPHKIGEFYTPDQRAMIQEIFRHLHNPDFLPKVLYHIQEDAGSLDKYSIALFGEPQEKGKKSKFEFVLTGRHCTIRCDGDSVDGAAFGGPIMYGHQSGPNGMEKPDHGQNVYWYQGKRANEVFNALDPKQRDLALIKTPPRAEASNKTVALKAKNELVGLPVSEMSKDQKALVGNVMSDLLLPFRKKDADEAMKLIKNRGGLDSLAMSFYKNLDLGNDGVWDVWQLESENMVWYFRGHPHVHTWVNIKA